MLITEILILLVLLLIFLQDISSRSVYWFMFPVLAALLVLQHLRAEKSFSDILQPCFINLAFLAIQLLVLTLYFSLKYKKPVNITNELLGVGDILFLCAIAFYLSVLNFIFFYIGSMIIVLLAWAGWQFFMQVKDRQIPLAGFQALIFALFVAGDWYLAHIKLTDDSWLVNLITK